MTKCDPSVLTVFIPENVQNQTLIFHVPSCVNGRIVKTICSVIAFRNVACFSVGNNLTKLKKDNNINLITVPTSCSGFVGYRVLQKKKHLVELK